MQQKLKGKSNRFGRMAGPVVLALGLVLPLSGCYTSQPLDAPVPMTGTRFVARLTDAGRVTMGNAIGPGAGSVEGIIASADATTWNVRLQNVTYLGGTESRWNGEEVSFPAGTLIGVTERKFSKKRSWLTGGLIALAAFLASSVFTDIGADEQTDNTPPPAN